MVKNAWTKVYRELTRLVDSVGGDILFFRDHSDESWKLLPRIARLTGTQGTQTEEIAYFDFVTKAGDLLPESSSAWAVPLAMQHHGFPTRLLDWTETLAVALLFALLDSRGDASVWILDPFALNNATLREQRLLRPSDLGSTYEEYFIKHSEELGAPIVALSPLRHHPRILRQRGAFTLHDNLSKPLEELVPGVVRKVVIPKQAHEDAANFLQHAGISEFALFPDLDGLSRELRRQYFE